MIVETEEILKQLILSQIVVLVGMRVNFHITGFETVSEVTKSSEGKRLNKYIILIKRKS